MTDLRVLSLHQPWASLVAVGVKSIETRSWPTKHRGRIGIASTARRVPYDGLAVGDWFAYRDAHKIKTDEMQHYARGEHGAPDDVVLPLGAIVATANLVDCVPIVEWLDEAQTSVKWNRDYGTLWLHRAGTHPADSENITDQRPYGDFTPGRWAWLLDDVKPTTERCPACWGTGVHAPSGPGDEVGWCETCHTHRGCDPVPVKGRQGLWRWNP